MEKEQFKNIGVLRFIGILVILYFHVTLCGLYNSIVDLSPIVSTLKYNASNGNIWVMFFFIMSGFFFFRYTNFANDFFYFFIKKVIRFWPIIFFSVFVYNILSHFTPMTYHRYINIFTLLLLNNVGFTGNNMGNLHPIWFVSVLFWTMCLYFYITKIFDKKYVNLFMGIVPFFSIAFITNSTFFPPAVYFNFINIGILEAMGGLSIGYWINEIYNMYNCKKVSSKNNILMILISITEIYLLIFIINNTVFHKMNFMNFLPLLFAFIMLFYLFLIKKGWVSQLLENKNFSFIGQYVYSIFVTHIIIFDLINEVFWKIHPYFVINHLLFNTFAVILLSIMFGVITYYLIEKPIGKWLNSCWKKLLPSGGDSRS